MSLLTTSSVDLRSFLFCVFEQFQESGLRNHLLLAPAMMPRAQGAVHGWVWQRNSCRVCSSTAASDSHAADTYRNGCRGVNQGDGVITEHISSFPMDESVSTSHWETSTLKAPRLVSKLSDVLVCFLLTISDSRQSSTSITFLIINLSFHSPRMEV